MLINRMNKSIAKIIQHRRTVVLININTNLMIFINNTINLKIKIKIIKIMQQKIYGNLKGGETDYVKTENQA